MDSILHYTTLTNAHRIVVSSLEPHTCPFSNARFEGTIPDIVRERIITSDKYLVGIPKNSLDAWQSSGLWDLFKLFSLGASVRLEVPVLKHSGAFVRDHGSYSPKALGTLFYMKRETMSSFQMRTFDEHVKRYMVDSVVPLLEYDGCYEIPEIWLPQTTPIEQIVISEVMAPWDRVFHNARRKAGLEMIRIESKKFEI